VSAIDREVEESVTRTILRARPDDGLIGEEGTDRESGSGVYWIVDPLDGTTNYLYGRREYSISIAAIEATSSDDARRLHGAPLAGVVSAPGRGEFYEASRGRPARCNGRVLATSREDVLEKALIGTGFSYDAATRVQQAVALTTVLARVGDVRRSGSAALDMCAVAGGQLDAYYEGPNHVWDIAAGVLIVRGAGGHVRVTWDHDSGTCTTRAASATLWDQFNDLLNGDLRAT
jgi:myo-inositol-1(or 4)-monophosphatase